MGVPFTITRSPVFQEARPASLGKARLSAIAVPLITTILLNVFCQSDVSFATRLLTSVVALVCWIPFVMHLWTGDTRLPFMPVISLIYAGQFVFVVFLREAMPLRYVAGDDVILKTETMVLLGVSCMMIGYYAWPKGALKLLPTIKVAFSPKSGVNKTVALGMLSLVLVQSSSLLAQRFSALSILANELAIACIALLFAYQLKGQLTFWQKFALWGLLIPLRIGKNAIGGGIGYLVGDLLALMGTYWLVRKKWPSRAVFLLAIPVLIIQGTKGEFRKTAWSQTQNLNSLQSAELLYDVVKKGFQEDQNFLTTCFESLVARADQATTLTAVVSMTPDVIPYWNGDSYVTLYWLAIPRFLYPDKPTKIIGNQFGQRYGLLDKKDVGTSYNTPQLVEFYANFGPWGVACGMLLIGIIGRTLQTILSNPNAGEAIRLLEPVVLAQLCAIESDFSLIYGGLLLELLAVVLILKFFHARSIHMPLDAFRLR